MDVRKILKFKIKLVIFPTWLTGSGTPGGLGSYTINGKYLGSLLALIADSLTGIEGRSGKNKTKIFGDRRKIVRDTVVERFS